MTRSTSRRTSNLVVGGVVVTGYRAASTVDPGFRGDDVLTMEYRLPQNKYPKPPEQARFHQAVVRQLPTLGVLLTRASRQQCQHERHSNVPHGGLFAQHSPAAHLSEIPRYFEALAPPSKACLAFGLQDGGRPSALSSGRRA